MNKKIIFLGDVGSSTTFSGELSKNREIIARLVDMGCDVTVIDSFQARSKNDKLVRMISVFFRQMFLNPHATILFSTSFENVYPLVKFLSNLPFRLHIIYWVIGGLFFDRVADGFFKKKYLKQIDLFIVEGIKMKKRMADLGFNNVWYESHFKTIGTLPQIRKDNDGKIHFLFISCIMPERGCQYILKSVKALNHQGLAEKFEVDFYGNITNGYRQEFEKEVANAANVNYSGNLQLQDERNYEVLARYHYMLFPTYWVGEGFPGVVIDAYKAGVPIIGSDWNLNPEFIKEGMTGILVPTRSVEKLTEVMANAINGKYDCALMSEYCQREVWKYDTCNVININLLDVIMNVKRSGAETKLRKWVKRNQWIYFLRYKLIDADYKRQRSAMTASSLKTPEEKKWEMKSCKDYWRCSPVQYIRYGLFDKQLSMDEMLDYIPAFRFYNEYMEKQLAGINESLYSNKLILYYLFRKYVIPTPAVIALVKERKLMSLDGKPLSYTYFISKLKRNKKYFFKPVDGAGGTGIEVLKNEYFDQCEAFIERLNKSNLYVVQEGIMQREDFFQINPSSVNTLRMVTQFNDVSPKICACVMRIGRNGKDVDNSHQGGMSCNINLNDGTLNETATAEHGGGTYYEHPDTGFIFKGKRIEGWEAIKNSVISYACYFPELKEIGWDIAITPEGLQVIEMNLGYGIDHLQVSCGGMRRKLNVYPD